MNKSVFKEVINASKEKTWDVLFNQYGHIQTHNPTMSSSNYMNKATQGELNCVRHTEFGPKYFIDEKISAASENKNMTVVVTNHNLPMVKKMSATYELSSLENGATELKMTSTSTFFPGFMKYLMRGQMGNSLLKHLFGMKYYIETGKTVDEGNYDKIFKEYA
ncbi:MAG: hypothetical protein ACI8ZM_004519 [Crocinitomix sp.]|jgi:hypothetical protein